MIREQNESSGANLVVGRRNQKGGGDDNVGESAKHEIRCHFWGLTHPCMNLSSFLQFT